MVKVKTFTQAVDGTTITLDRDKLGYAPGDVYAQHTIQGTNLGGGTFDVYVLGPAGAFVRVITGLTEGQLAVLGPLGSWSQNGTALPRQRFRALRVVLAGTAAASVGIESTGVAVVG